MFESLNSTGLSLTNVDLLRNYLLMQHDYNQQTYLYDKYWAEIENNVGPAEMENFLLITLYAEEKAILQLWQEEMRTSTDARCTLCSATITEVSAERQELTDTMPLNAFLLTCWPAQKNTDD